MLEISDDEAYDNVEIDFTFSEIGPEFGDLFTVCGYVNPNFPPKGKFNFDSLLSFKISQIDDEGDDVAVWFYPIINGEVVNHHPGPFSGLRLSYCTLRNPREKADLFLELASAIEKNYCVTLSQSVESAKQKIDAVVAYWAGEGIKVGSDESLEIDY